MFLGLTGSLIFRLIVFPKPVIVLLCRSSTREKYEMNLKRDLPHIPFTDDFSRFANAGVALADLHVNYESVPKYDGLRYIETPGMQVDWRVEKIKRSKDKTQRWRHPHTYSKYVKLW